MNEYFTFVKVAANLIYPQLCYITFMTRTSKTPKKQDLWKRIKD